MTSPANISSSSFNQATRAAWASCQWGLWLGGLKRMYMPSPGVEQSRIERAS